MKENCGRILIFCFDKKIKRTNFREAALQHPEGSDLSEETNVAKFRSSDQQQPRTHQQRTRHYDQLRSAHFTLVL